MLTYPNWAAAVVFVLAFGESLAFVSLVLPFWAMLVAIGAIIGGTNSLNFWIIVTAAASGAALGDWLSYWLGYHYHERIQTMWPLKNHPDAHRKGPRVLRQVGGVGDRAGALLRTAARQRADRGRDRADAAGMFQLANWSSAFLWAFVLLSPGAVGMKWWFDYFS